MEEGVDPHYNSVISLKAAVSGATLELDAGVVLRAIDTLLMIAPPEFRKPKEWMIRLYKTRVEIVKTLDCESEAIVDKEISNERGNSGESLNEFNFAEGGAEPIL